MEAEDDRGELIYEEVTRVAMRWGKAPMVAVPALWVVLMLIPAWLALRFPRPGSSEAAAVLVIAAVVGAVVWGYIIWVLRPLRLYERGLTNRLGKFISYEKLNRVHMAIMAPPSTCWVSFSKSLAKMPMVNFTMEEAEVNAYNHIELARRLEDLDLVVSAAKHPKAEDDGLVDMTRGMPLLQEPPEVFSAWRRRTLAMSGLIIFSFLVLVIAAIAGRDFLVYGSVGQPTVFVAPLLLVLGALLTILVFFILPRDGWCLYERGLVLHPVSELSSRVRYEDCAYAVLRQPKLFGTGSLRVYLKGLGIAGAIPVGEKKHAYGDVDRLVELLESKGVPVER